MSLLNSIPFSLKPIPTYIFFLPTIYMLISVSKCFWFTLCIGDLFLRCLEKKGPRPLPYQVGIKNGIQKWLNLDLTGLRLPLQIFCKKVQKRAENQRNAFDTVTKGQNDFWRSIENYYSHNEFLLAMFSRFFCQCPSIIYLVQNIL